MAAALHAAAYQRAVDHDQPFGALVPAWHGFRSSARSRAGTGHTLSRASGTRVLHVHPRHATARSDMAPVFRVRLDLSDDSRNTAKLPVAGFARGLFLCPTRPDHQLRGL